MPPDLDVYVVSNAREHETINRFLDSYCDRAASEDRGGEELMISPLDSCDEEPTRLENWEWEPSKTLTHIVERGLEHPRRAFCVYLKPRDASLRSMVLAFTSNDRVIFGASLDDEGAKQENLERATVLLHQLAREFGAHLGFVCVETGPPLTRSSNIPDQIIYFWESKSHS